MCEVCDIEKSHYIPIMLCGDALELYSRRGGECKPFYNSTSLLLEWYNPPEKQSRILKECEGVRLSSELMNNPNQSYISVFRSLVARPMSL